MARLSVRGLARGIPHLRSSGAGAIPLPSLTSPVAAWSVHEDDIANVYQDSAKTTPAVSDGDVIGAVVQLAGFGAVDASQTTTAAKPLLQTDANGINNHNAALFDGSGDYLSADAIGSYFGGVDAPVTLYAVVEVSNTTGVKLLLGAGSSGSATPLFLVRLNGAVVEVLKRDATNLLVTVGTGTLSSNIPAIVSIVHTGTATSVAINGTLIDNTVAQNVGDLTTFNTFRLGAHGHITPPSSFWTGKIGANMVYNAAHSTAEREAMEAHLASKWGITLA